MGTHTFIMLKPDALQRGLVHAITGKLLKAGFFIENLDYCIATAPLIDAHYKDIFAQLGDEFKAKMYAYIVGQPILPMVLSHAHEDAITFSRQLIGQTDPPKAAKGTIRGDFGVDSMEAAAQENRCVRNLIHGSDSPLSFAYEQNIWFPARG